MALQKYGAPEPIDRSEEGGALQPQPEFLQDGAVGLDGEPVEQAQENSDSALDNGE